MKDTSEEEEETKRNEGDRKKVKQMCSCRQGGCLSWSLWMKRRQKEKQKASDTKKDHVLVYYVSGCQRRAKVVSRK